MKNENVAKKELSAVERLAKETPKPKKSRKGQKIPVIYKDITNQTAAQILEEHIKFKLPEGGIHKPCVWKGRDGWGASYRVFANVPPSKIAGPKFTKHLLISVKWKGLRDLLVPVKGQAELLKTIDIKPAEYFKNLII